ncbi:hypothetical protein [Mucilaginibacter sp. SP1R1]|uniref:hypothetical protein n=1 Tax=Mucilaginibacter sp. SP1R1 TaxID=2723091 RepID=UPI00161E92F7|nr:hypothetical protein [Mucilaginibacter sp. SP1R1]MBB6151451.1 hypothetical protein [Mucilaginibacter sp. SP1R1]
MKKRLVFSAIMLLVSTVVFSQNVKPIKLNPQNLHYFIYKGKPALLVGSGEHYGSVINLGFDYKTYLQTVANDGLNTTRLFTGAYIEKPGDFGIKSNTLAPSEQNLVLPWKRSDQSGFELGGNKFDLDKWDEGYFIRLKQFMAEANRNDVIVEVNLFSSYYQHGWEYSALNTKNNINKTDEVSAGLVNTLQNGNILAYQEKYVRKIVRELNGFGNFYFEIQNEPYAIQKDTVILRNEYGDVKDFRNFLEVVSQRSNDWQQRVAGWIKDEESKLANQHLLSQNISNFHYPITNPDANISIFNFHYALPNTVGENYYLNKVIGFNETGFAGSLNTTYRRQAWRFLMAGGALFNQLDYSFSAGMETGQDTSYKAPGGGSPELRKQFGILKHYFDALDFVNLHPDLRVVKASPGAITEALSDDNKQWVIYLEHIAMKPYSLILNLPKGTYKATWTDVVTGNTMQTFTLTNNIVNMPAGITDKVLRIAAMH